MFCFLEAELQRICDPEMFEKPANVTSTVEKTPKVKGKIQQGKNKVCRV